MANFLEEEPANERSRSKSPSSISNGTKTSGGDHKPRPLRRSLSMQHRASKVCKACLDPTGPGELELRGGGGNCHPDYVEEFLVQAAHGIKCKTCLDPTGVTGDTLPDYARYSANISTTPITAMGCQLCLPLSVVQLKGKHCRKLHCRNGVVDTFGHRSKACSFKTEGKQWSVM